MNRSMMKWVLAAGIGLAGCGAPEASLEDEENVMDDGKYEAWNRANNPAYVDSTFVYEVDRLPVAGEMANTPIPGDYWATQKDSINHRWDGADSLSPAEKFAKAFNVPDFPKTITNEYGIYGHGRKECKETSECDDLKDGSSCVTPRGATGEKPGRCIPGWWGICHGWAPFALAEAKFAPVKEVTKNGVTFYPGDLEALGSLLYSENLPTKFLSQRCNLKPEDIKTDPTGRVINGECIDMNPGSVHVVATNFLGLRKEGFVEDRTYSDQVWNQPVRSYKITNAVDGKLKEIQKAEAISLLGLGLGYKPLLAETVVKKSEKKSGSYTVEADGALIIKMSGTGDGDLHVKRGAEATDAVYDCRPYAGGSDEECKFNDAKVGEKFFYMINGYGDESKVSLQIGSASGGTEYIYNTAAKRFFHVEMDLNYITESQPARMSHVGQIDTYTRTDHYEYILETDAAGRIQGGEWLGSSRQSHPDFAWWPTAAPRSAVNGVLKYEMVRSLLEGASAGGTTVTPVEKKLFEGAQVTVRSSSKYEAVGVPGGAKLKVTMTGTGNADLYVRLGAKPTIYTFAAKSVGSTSEESLEVTAPASGGTYYVRVRPTSGEAKVTVTATITPAR
jgi:hypothetical protein